ncbi:PBPRA1643 family SWIM/SEC-C metal-binding motif protein [Spongorhabdus nitratireducens]
MSDKFFFKGRQDARVNYVECGYEPNANYKAGTKKNPLKLVVKDEAREQEIKAMLKGAGLYGEISVDEEADESIGQLTTLLTKIETVVNKEKLPSRNDPCHCGSGKKFKKCCA